MKSNRGFATKLEITLSKLLCKRLVRTGLPGSPEFVYPTARVAVFALGCFWHHCPVCNLSIPKTHRAYWKRKFARNAEHDQLVRRELESAGWTVLEVWEHEVKENPRLVVTKIQQLVRQQERHRRASTAGQGRG
jgi:DNA mismatch endonuclease, patch repair protein